MVEIGLCWYPMDSIWGDRVCVEQITFMTGTKDDERISAGGELSVTPERDDAVLHITSSKANITVANPLEPTPVCRELSVDEAV